MNDLERYFAANSRNRIHKWAHYFEVYDRHFARFRGTPVQLLEIGVDQGGSLQMWKHYFGPLASITGVDINPACKALEEEQIQILIGDQADPKFLASLAAAMPRIDILIDDGGHTMRQQVLTFEILFPCVQPDGLYVCEDLHTSYWRGFGGGYRRRGSFIEHSKGLVDALHAWHSKEPKRLGVTAFTRSAFALHFYDSMLVIEKRVRERPHDVITGSQILPPRPGKPPSLSRRFKRWIGWSKPAGTPREQR